MKNERLLNKLYSPNDRLGVQFFGVDEWNRQKEKVCEITNDVIDGRAIPVNRGGADYTQLFNVLFVPNRQAFSELLGSSGIVDVIDRATTSSDWWGTWMNIKDAGENVAEMIPIAQPFVSAGKKVNKAISSVWDRIRGKSDETPTVVKAGIGLGGLLLIGGAAYGIYYMSKKKKRRR